MLMIHGSDDQVVFAGYLGRWSPIFADAVPVGGSLCCVSGGNLSAADAGRQAPAHRDRFLLPTKVGRCRREFTCLVITSKQPQSVASSRGACG